MNLTPRDKALLEYGKALGRLTQWHKDNNDAAIKHLLHCRQIYRKQLVVCKEVELHDDLVKDAWAKRKACRATVKCASGDNFLEGIPGKSCHLCFGYDRRGDRYMSVVECKHFTPGTEG